MASAGGHTNEQQEAPVKASRHEEVWRDTEWRVVDGVLTRPRGRPGKVSPLFRVVAEKIPFDALGDVARHMRDYGIDSEGVYLAHDSMGFARYAGRGSVFQRLKARYKAQPLELEYFSFYIVANKIHEREIETIIIRAAGPLLHFNDRKKRVDIRPGSLLDYEPGTMYYARRPNGRGVVYEYESEED